VINQAEPADVVDRLLWRDAQLMLDRHTAADLNGCCAWCGHSSPCQPRRLAERAAAASRRPWREGWTARHDLTSQRDWRAARYDRRGARLNRGLFD